MSDRQTRMDFNEMLAQRDARIIGLEARVAELEGTVAGLMLADAAMATAVAKRKLDLNPLPQGQCACGDLTIPKDVEWLGLCGETLHTRDRCGVPVRGDQNDE